MAVEAKFDSFNVGIDAVTTTFDRTGYGFQFGGIIGAWSGRTEAADAVGLATHQRGMGLGVSPSSQAMIATQSEHAAPAANSDQIERNDAFIGNLDTTGTEDGRIGINSKNSDGWQGIRDNAFVTDIRAHVLALGMDCELVQATEPAGIGIAPINHTAGKTAKAVIFISTPGATTPPTPAVDSRYMLGIAVNAGGTIKNGIVAGASNNGSDPTVTACYCRVGTVASGEESIAGVDIGVTGLNTRARVEAFNSGSVDVNWLEVLGNQARDYFCLFIYEGEHDLIPFNAPTNTTPFNLALWGNWTPVGGMIGSADTVAYSTADTLAAKDEWSLGMFAWNPSGTLEQGCHAVRDGDAIGTTVVTTAVRYGSVFADLSATGTVDAEGAITARVAGQVTFQMVTTDAFVTACWAWVFGEFAKGLRRQPQNLDGLGTYRTDPCGV